MMSDSGNLLTATPAGSAGSYAGQYLTFELGSEVYGLEILTVQEIIGLMAITKVPKTPDYVRGVINLRGKVIPVIGLRKKFQMPPVDDTERTCIIVVQVENDGGEMTMGILVDEVKEVVDVKASEIESAPSFGASVKTGFILAMGKVGGRVVILLNVNKVLTIGELDSIESTLSSAKP